MKQQTAIDNLYSVFRKYTTSDMFYCDCGCIDPNDVKKLASKPLRALEEEDFTPYHGSALYTWGNLEHYKHFLPRILEVHHIKHGQGWIGLYEITTKLNYAEWETWPAEEVKAIKDFILVDWVARLNHQTLPIDKDDFEYYVFFLKIEKLLQHWKVTESGIELKKLVDFLYNDGEESLYNKILNSGISIHHLIQKLEETFFKIVEIDNEYAERLSIVLQMIETIVAIEKKR